jgi:hypothetical protein
MPKYQIKVSETRRYNVLYTVIADCPEEALELAEAGETDAESNEYLIGVDDRNIISEPELAP